MEESMFPFHSEKPTANVYHTMNIHSLEGQSLLFLPTEFYVYQEFEIVLGKTLGRVFGKYIV